MKWINRSLIGLILLSVSIPTLAGPPEIPEVKMQHREEFIDIETKEKRRIYKTKYSMGAEIWHSSRKKYVKHGAFLTFHSDGSVYQVTNWEYGVKHGAYQSYNKKGTLKEEGSYLSGKKSGTWIRYTDKGRMSSRSEYKNGKRNGQTIDYNLWTKQEQPHFIKHYKDGKLHGAHEQYNDKGKKVAWGTYVEGKRHGAWYDYDWNGNVRSKSWVNGKLQK